MFESTIVNEAPLTVNPEAVPLIDRASVSAFTVSAAVDSVKAPDPEADPAVIVTTNDSSPGGIEKSAASAVPASTDTETAAAASTVNELATVAVTFTVRFDIPSAILF